MPAPQPEHQGQDQGGDGAPVLHEATGGQHDAGKQGKGLLSMVKGAHHLRHHVAQQKNYYAYGNDRYDDGVDERRQNLVAQGRSEEHTSELQSLMRSSYAVFCLIKKYK